ncbi:MAG: type 1 glutamine amidotransferase domain-containing protein [Ferruginibacter sp.]
MKSLRSLIITTSNNKLEDTNNKTGVWLEDLAAPYFIFKDGGEFITIASPSGGQIPIDANSQSLSNTTENTKRFIADARAMYQFSHAIPLKEIKAEDYDLVFLAGGYGAMWDFAGNKSLNEILQLFVEDEKLIGFVGHAVVALCTLTHADGSPLIKNRKLTSFSNSEEEAIVLNEKPPFLLETKLIELGASFSKKENFSSYVVVDENIVTGQNPASAIDVAKQMLLLALS